MTAALRIEGPPTSAPGASRAVRVENLVKVYHTAIGPRRVLDGISLDLPSVHAFVLIGPSASGDTGGITPRQRAGAESVS